MSWLLPSRGRVDQAVGLAEVAPDAPITLWLSADDPALPDYEAREWPDRWTVRVGMQGLRLAQILREFYRENPDLPYYGFLGDDVVPEPAGWWRTLGEAAQPHFVAHPDDSIWHDRLCPHFCLGGDLVRAAGWMALPRLRHSFLDTAWYAIGDRLGLLRYTPDVRFRHDHPLKNPSVPVDATYQRGQETYAWDHDVFERWAQGAMQVDLERIAAGLSGNTGGLGGQKPDIPRTAGTLAR